MHGKYTLQMVAAAVCHGRRRYHGCGDLMGGGHPWMAAIPRALAFPWAAAISALRAHLREESARRIRVLLGGVRACRMLARRARARVLPRARYDVVHSRRAHFLLASGRSGRVWRRFIGHHRAVEVRLQYYFDAQVFHPGDVISIDTILHRALSSMPTAAPKMGAPPPGTAERRLRAAMRDLLQGGRRR